MNCVQKLFLIAFVNIVTFLRAQFFFLILLGVFNKIVVMFYAGVINILCGVNSQASIFIKCFKGLPTREIKLKSFCEMIE